MHPVSHRAFEISGVSVNEAREFTLELREDIVEGKCVSGEMNPARVGSKDSKSLTRPKTIRLAPVSYIGDEFFHVGSESTHVVFPSWSASINIQALFEDACPFRTIYVLINLSESLRTIHSCEIHGVCKVNILLQLLVSLMILMVQRTTFILNNSSKSIKICSSCCGGNLSTETVTSNGRHSDFILVHPSDNIGGKVFHIVRSVMIRSTLVSIIEHPDIADIQDLVSLHRKETREVLCWFDELR